MDQPLKHVSSTSRYKQRTVLKQRCANFPTATRLLPITLSTKNLQGKLKSGLLKNSCLKTSLNTFNKWEIYSALKPLNGLKRESRLLPRKNKVLKGYDSSTSQSYHQNMIRQGLVSSLSKHYAYLEMLH